MKIKLFLGFILVSGLMASPAFADLGLGQILAEQGASGVGQAVKTAVTAAYTEYAETGDLELLKSKIVAILNEAEATGDPEAMRYAMVAVILVGGVDNIDNSKDFINSSQIAVNYPELVAFTVSAADSILSGQPGGGDGELGGGGGEGSELGGGEEDSQSLGGGDPDIFDDGTVTPYGTIEDRDSSATPV